MRCRSRLCLALALGVATVALGGGAALAQTQIRPRVLVMVDTSGSMTLHLDSNVLDSGGDGSFYYEDAVLTRGNLNGPAVQFSMDPGFSTAGQCGPNPTFDTNSRMLVAKAAVTNVINGSGDIDWALMRYAGTYCAIDNTPSLTDSGVLPRFHTMAWPNANFQAGSTNARELPNFVCTSSTQCAGSALCSATMGKCVCVADADCPNGTHCDEATGRCLCSDSTECPGDTVCNVATGMCLCNSNDDCTSGACNTTSGQCVCDGSSDCRSGACNTTTGLCTCTASSHCAGFCDNGSCICTSNFAGPNGNIQCLSGACTRSTGICGCDGATQNGINDCASTTCLGVDTDPGAAGTQAVCGCASGANCLSGSCNTGTGSCTCSDDGDCHSNEFCVGGSCIIDDNMCIRFTYGSTSTRNRNVCVNQYDLPNTFIGSCGTRQPAGNALCATRQTCYANADCASGNCDLSQSGVQSGKWGFCTCGACPTNYTCSGGFCVYNLQCIPNGGVVVVDPANTGGTSADALKWVDGREIYTAGGNVNTDNKTNPELRAVGSTPLAGAARAATEWYNGITLGEDPKKACRPYVLVQITDGFDTCEHPNPTLIPEPAENNIGPVAAAQSFVGSTITNAKVPNKVYVIGLAFGGASTVTLDDIAKAGGTTKARLANTQQEIEAALADIVSSSILVEKCNNADDDCNDACDEPFPGVAVTGPGCSNMRAATACDNGLLGHCNAPGVFVCESVNQLSQICQTRQCTSGTGNLTKVGNVVTLTALTGTFTSADNGKIVTITSTGANRGNFTLTFVNSTTVTYTNASGAAQNGVTWNIYCVNSEDTFGCNGFDDNCDGLKDNCASAPTQEGSCCVSACPACAAGGPFAETCNNCDDDCDGTVDNNLTDVGFACGTDVGICKAGTQQCCQFPTGACGGVGTMGTNAVRCIGGFPDPLMTESCNGVDDDCDTQTDEGISQACFAPSTPGAPDFAAPATPGNGPCRNGARACAASSCGTAPNACCPGGWPAGKPCPGPATFSTTCVGAVGPDLEVCNNIDDDCDGTIDNNLSSARDPWFGQTCCPTGNLADCPNMNGCMPGTLQCVTGGQQCVGGKARTQEICNGVDDDCNGTIDDIPGLNAPCTDNGGTNIGPCRARYVCDPLNPGSGPFGLTCVQQVGPMPEVCNGADDDCDGKTDELNDTGPMNDVTDNDSSIGTPCDVPAPPADKPPCMPGTTVCSGGRAVCDGAVKPIPNECGKPATDCTGNPGSVCPEGAVCYMGLCVTECANTEFPCPGGFRCDRTQTPNLCLPDACTRLNCPADQICRIANDGTASCVDPCVGVNCPTGFRCRGGACIDDSCRTFGCQSGQVCRGNPATCQTDPCANLTCDAGQYCNNGECRNLCTTPCLSGQACVDGLCVDDPCEDKTCTAGQVCRPAAGVATCVENTCLNMACGTDRVCCGGGCIDDPCLSVVCPAPTVCTRTSSCIATCTVTGTQGAEERIVGAGGGGVACSMGGRASSGGEGAFLVFFGLFAFFVLRRRRQEVR